MKAERIVVNRVQERDVGKKLRASKERRKWERESGKESGRERKGQMRITVGKKSNILIVKVFFFSK